MSGRRSGGRAGAGRLRGVQQAPPLPPPPCGSFCTAPRASPASPAGGCQPRARWVQRREALGGATRAGGERGGSLAPPTPVTLRPAPSLPRAWPSRAQPHRPLLLPPRGQRLSPVPGCAPPTAALLPSAPPQGPRLCDHPFLKLVSDTFGAGHLSPTGLCLKHLLICSPQNKDHETTSVSC